VRVVRRLKRDRWTSREGQGWSKISIVAEHVEFKPNLNGEDGDGKDGEGAAGHTSPADGAATEQAREEAELTEAASF
jgi:single-strand DNA-binding protein